MKKLILILTALCLSFILISCRLDNTMQGEDDSKSDATDASSENESESKSDSESESDSETEATTQIDKEALMKEIYESTPERYIPIGGWATPATQFRDTRYDELFGLIKDSGINYMISLEEWSSKYWCIDSLRAAHNAGIKLYYNCVGQGNMLEMIQHMLDSEYSDALGGIYVKDEPLLSEMEELGNQTAAVKELLGDRGLPVFSNLLPTYAQSSMIGDSYRDYINAYLENVDSDILMFDYYPYTGQKDTIYDMIANIAMAKEAADAKNIPLYTFIQSSGTASMREPSYTELKLNVNLNLAMGVKGFAYFLTCEVYENWGYSAMIDYNGNTTDMYDKIKDVNSDINAMKGVYLDYDYKGIILSKYANGTKAMKEAGCEVLTGYSSLNNVGSTKECAVGCFENESGEVAYYAVNLSYLIPTKITMNFESDVSYEIWGENGLSDIGTTKDGKLVLTLSAGEGMFIKIKN